MSPGSTPIVKEEEAIQMSAKGASYRYGNTKGANHRGEATEHINYAWAKAFNRGGLKHHFKEHGKEMGCRTIKEYETKAIKFANTVNRDKFNSVIDKHGTTYKYDPERNILVEVTKDGYIISFRHYGESFWYIDKNGVKQWIK